MGETPFLLKLSPITRLILTLDREMDLDPEKRVFNRDSFDRYLAMHQESERRMHRLLKSTAVSDFLLMLILSNGHVDLPLMGISLAAIPALPQVMLVVACFGFLMLSFAWVNEQAYRAVVSKFAERDARPLGIDPDFITASVLYTELGVKLYRSKFNVWGDDFFRPGRRYTIFFRGLLGLFTISIILLLVLHLVLIGYAVYATSTEIVFSLAHSVGLFCVVATIAATLIFTTILCNFAFFIDPPKMAEP